MSIDLRYSLEYLGGGPIPLGYIYLFGMFWWGGSFVCQDFCCEAGVGLMLYSWCLFGV